MRSPASSSFSRSWWRSVLGLLAAVVALSWPAAATAQSSPADLVGAVVVRIDGERGTVTLRHEPVPALHLPAATTTFRYIDPRLILRIRDGDSIRFRADRIDGSLRLIAVWPAPPGARP